MKTYPMPEAIEIAKRHHADAVWFHIPLGRDGGLGSPYAVDIVGVRYDISDECERRGIRVTGSGMGRDEMDISIQTQNFREDIDTVLSVIKKYGLTAQVRFPIRKGVDEDVWVLG